MKPHANSNRIPSLLTLILDWFLHPAPSITQVEPPYENIGTFYVKGLFWPDSMAQWQDCQPASVLGGMGYRVQSQARAIRGSIPLQTGATAENLHFLLFIVCRPIIGRDYLEELHIKFISSFMLSVSSAYTKKALLFTCLSHPWKRVVNPLNLRRKKKVVL